MSNKVEKKFHLMHNGMNDCGIYGRISDCIGVINDKLMNYSHLNPQLIFDKTEKGMRVMVYEYSTIYKEIFTIKEV